MKVEIREAKKEDLERIAEIYKKEYSKEPYNEKWKKKNALDMVEGQFEGSNVLIALQEEKVIGFISFTSFPWEQSYKGYIMDFAVDSEFQGEGVGTKLMEETEKKLKTEGVKSIALNSHLRSDAFEFYKKRGYERNEMVGLEKDI